MIVTAAAPGSPHPSRHCRFEGALSEQPHRDIAEPFHHGVLGVEDGQRGVEELGVRAYLLVHVDAHRADPILRRSLAMPRSACFCAVGTDTPNSSATSARVHS